MKSLSIETSEADTGKHPNVLSFVGGDEKEFKILVHSFDLDWELLKVAAIETIKQFAGEWEYPKIAVGILRDVDYLAVVQSLGKAIVHEAEVLCAQHGACKKTANEQ